MSNFWPDLGTSEFWAMVSTLVNAGLLLVAWRSLRDNARSTAEALKSTLSAERKLRDSHASFEVGVTYTLEIADRNGKTVYVHEGSLDRGYGDLTNFGPGTAHNLQCYFIVKEIHYKDKALPMSHTTRALLRVAPELHPNNNRIAVGPSHLLPAQVAKIASIPEIAKSKSVSGILGTYIITYETALEDFRVTAVAVTISPVEKSKDRSESEHQPEAGHQPEAVHQPEAERRTEATQNQPIASEAQSSPPPAPKVDQPDDESAPRRLAIEFRHVRRSDEDVGGEVTLEQIRKVGVTKAFK
jgi:hypothetical protein